MKPHDPKKLVEGISRAKMFINKDIRIFCGYPLQNENWMNIVEGKDEKIIKLTSKEIHSAIYMVNFLVREFPKALPAIVGDVGKWKEMHFDFINVVKSFLKNEIDYDYSCNILLSKINVRSSDIKFYKKLCKINTSTKKIANIFLWITFLEPDKFKDAMKWLECNEKIVKIIDNKNYNDDILLIIKLWHISRLVGEKRTKIVIDWLLDDRIFQVPISGVNQYVNEVYSSFGKKRRNESIPIKIKANFGKSLIEWTYWLATQKPRYSKKSIDLFSLTIYKNIFDEWEKWWSNLEIEILKAKKLRNSLINKEYVEIFDKLTKVREKILEFNKKTPPMIRRELYFSLIKEFSEDKYEDYYKIILNQIKLFPIEYNKMPIRLVIILTWFSNINYEHENKNKIPKIIIETTRFIRSQKNMDKSSSIWKDSVENLNNCSGGYFYSYTILDEIIEEIKFDEISDFMSILINIYSKNHISSLEKKEWTNLVMLFNLVEKDKVIKIFLDLKKARIFELNFGQYKFKIALKIVMNKFEYLSELIGVLDKVDDFLEEIGELVLIDRLNEVFPQFILHSIVGKKYNDIMKIALNYRMIKTFNSYSPLIKEIQNPDILWIDRYSNDFKEILINLSKFDLNAKTTAEKFLGKYFPSKELIKSEIFDLEMKILKNDKDNDFIRLRIDKLRKKIIDIENNNCINYKQLSEIKIKNLKNKLNNSLMIAILEILKNEVQEKVNELIFEKLEINYIPKWFEQKKIIEIVNKSADLDLEFQGYLLKILKKRLKDRPWDFRDESLNNEFLEKLKNKNINIYPWIDGEDKIVKKLKTGEKIEFSIERDPLEILFMGKYFKTCLSPGSINFFSVLSNIIDINKQILYGRDESGKVVSRVLLALTDEGGILSFKPYSNLENFDFGDVVKEFVLKISEQMRTFYVSNGVVKKIIVSNWYNDGPRELDIQFPFMDRNSEFRSSLPKWSVEEIQENIKKVIKPYDLNEIMIPFFIDILQFDENENLSHALFPYILKYDNIETDKALVYYEFLLKTNNYQILKPFINRIYSEIMISYKNYSMNQYNSLLKVLVEIDPSNTLKALNQTKEKYIKNWNDECNYMRIEIAMRAYDKLNRKNNYLKLLEIINKNK